MVRGIRAWRLRSAAMAVWLAVTLAATAPMRVFERGCETAEPPCAGHRGACPTAVSATCCCHHPQLPLMTPVVPLLVARPSLIPCSHPRTVHVGSQALMGGNDRIPFWLTLPRPEAGPPPDLVVLHLTLRL